MRFALLTVTVSVGVSVMYLCCVLCASGRKCGHLWCQGLISLHVRMRRVGRAVGEESCEALAPPQGALPLGRSGGGVRGGTAAALRWRMKRVNSSCVMVVSPALGSKLRKTPSRSPPCSVFTSSSHWCCVQPRLLHSGEHSSRSIWATPPRSSPSSRNRTVMLKNVRSTFTDSSHHHDSQPPLQQLPAPLSSDVSSTLSPRLSAGGAVTAAARCRVP
jgi:hypothetical protein